MKYFPSAHLNEKKHTSCSRFFPSVPPSIKDHGSDSLSVVNVREGTSVSLECESNAVPPPVVTWYKNGRMITESTHVEVLAGGQMLHIKKAEVHLLFLFACHDSLVGFGREPWVLHVPFTTVYDKITSSRPLTLLS